MRLLPFPRKSAEACAACPFEFHKKIYQSQTLLSINFCLICRDAHPSLHLHQLRVPARIMPKFRRNFLLSWSTIKSNCALQFSAFSIRSLIDCSRITQSRPHTKKIMANNHVLERLCAGIFVKYFVLRKSRRASNSPIIDNRFSGIHISATKSRWNLQLLGSTLNPKDSA